MTLNPQSMVGWLNALPPSLVSDSTVAVVGDPITGQTYTASLSQILALGSGVINVKAYGALGDGVTDDYTAISNAIAVAQASTFKPIVFFPAGRYRISRPLRVTTQGVRLMGAGGRLNTELLGSFVYGPLMVVAPSVASGYAGVPTGPALLTGTGSAMTFDGTNTYFLSLRRDCQTCDLNGLTAFTAEGSINKASGTFGSNSVIVSSNGRRLRSDTNGRAFELGVLGGGQPYAYITVGGVLKSLFGVAGTVTVGVTHHLALSWDGTNARLFLNGTQVATTGAVGTLTQSLTEDVTVGPSIQDWPEATLATGVQAGISIDNVRLSNTARYTAGFTAPTAKFASDANTLALLTFDNQTDIFTVMHTKNGDAWLPLRRTNLVGTTNCPYVEIMDLGFNTGTTTSGLYVFYCQNGVFDRLRVTGEGPTGLFLGYNSYECSVDNLYTALGGSTFHNQIAVVMNVSVGVTRFGHPTFIGSAIQLVACGSSSHLDMPFFAQSTDTVYNALFKGAGGRDSHTLTSPLVDSESPGGAFVASLLLSELAHFTAIGSELEMFTTQPVWIDDNGKDGVYDFSGGSAYFATSAPASVFKIVGTAPKRPIRVSMGQTGTGTPVPWADAAGAVQVANLGYRVIAFSATPIFDAYYYRTFAMTLTANVTSSTLIHGEAGQEATFVLTQDITGGRTFAWPTNVKGAGVVLATANKVSVQSFLFDGTNWRATGPIQDAT